MLDYETTGYEQDVTAVVIDSREARPGSLFVALPGERADGHDFVADAFEHGAMAALVERPVGGEWPLIDTRRSWAEQVGQDQPPPNRVCLLVEDTLQALQQLAGAWRPRFPHLRVVGITGSVGKTTTKELTHAVLSRRFRTLKSEGSFNNEIGLPLTLLNLRPHHQRAVLEMGMYTTGEIRQLCQLARPQVGVVTMIGPVHLERAGSLEAIVAAKQELVEELPAAPEGVAILNQDEPLVMGMAGHTRARVFTYGLDDQANLWADKINSMGLEGIRFTLHHGRERLNVHVPLLGRHSVHTALRAAAVGLVEGLSWEEIVGGLQGMKSQLRLVVVSGPKHSIILDDTYNSSPASAIAALNLLADLDGRKVAVLGDMLELGAAEVESHRLVGRRARDVTQILVAVGPLGRLIGEEALAAGMASGQVFFAPDAEAAVPLLEGMVEPADVILIKGSRGARLDRIVAALSRD
ncbi:MAG: UDP-N-acetylmuramoyl-tripeptide--D-alanyl-D-alanine ligase [Chloroflexi bacterium]|nr:UDP-N-acetylmuramoyl-tripeptide--D-alanyl-D-alanine ligase [Chloroflexota bacterium]MCI0575390.1 UDP-N-acetylmuramoyl-tripeptide--D-alanyl-D-alanine ligase [Chloroflexota bacterium]MCI0643851.1 UDP-N-acetylmuramoyl-tripeptide--D-alanyl-D-alanine ligase [Chloroflexota bacterium]MCI0726713.1 UDP-N-acetylmuramoyl-tripeptide--D-alanyl-D-alanine ligase [Chloroflexota bacterium]